MRHCRDDRDAPRLRKPLQGLRHPMNQTPSAAAPTIVWADVARHALFDAWVADITPRHALRAATLSPASSDASFRRYFRIEGGAGSFIVMDAPPAHEDVRPFVRVGELMLGAGLNAPRIVEQSEEHGFLLLCDLGNRLYLNE